MIAEFVGTAKDDLILHWGISKKNFGEWTSPDDRYLPKETTRFQGGIGQSKFISDRNKPVFRSVHIKIHWKDQMEPAVKSMSFVFYEPSRNIWHNNGGKNYNIGFELSA
jgi:hypothetical protein